MKGQSLIKFLKDKLSAVYLTSLALICSLVIVFVMLPFSIHHFPRYNVGQRAYKDVRASTSVVVERRNAPPIVIKRGEIVIRKGQKITKLDIEKLKALESACQKRYKPNKYLSLFLLSLLSFFALYKLFKILEPALSKDFKNIAFAFVVFTLDVVWIRMFTFFARTSLDFFNVPAKETLIYVPVITVTVFLSMFLSRRLAVACSAIAPIIPSFVLSKPLLFFAPVAVGGVMSSLDSKDYRSRRSIYRSTFYFALGVVLTQLILLLYVFGFKLSAEYLTLPLLSIVGALISAVIIMGLAPVFASLFNFTSDIVYSELVNLNHPLLRRLILKAPGTYSHSVLVSTLAEAAAEAIGANPVLAKAGGLFHDVGKLKNPQAFVENQSGVNVHDVIPPQKSVAILRGHVEYGVELARQYGLPEPIIDIIRQHHGTKLMKYFYAKAKEKDGDVDEKNFRYPGPKPQFKEAGIIMLADTVEAATRSVKGKIKDLESYIHRVIMDDIADGQLTDSGLSLKDVEKIKSVLVKLLSGMFHSRVEYPDANFKGNSEGDNLRS